MTRQTLGYLVAVLIAAGCAAGIDHTRPRSVVVDEAAQRVRPQQWLARVRRCSVRGRAFCDGPRMIPMAPAAARARAEALGLGARRTVATLLVRAPRPEWVSVAGATSATLRWPVDGGNVVRGVGYVRRQALRNVHHDGVDIAAPVGTRVFAANDAIVAYADNSVRGFGNLVALVHADGSTTLYAHLAESWVAAGESVRRGEVIGLLGNTGLSRGPHLHFEWRIAGRPADPLPRLHEEASSGSTEYATVR